MDLLKNIKNKLIIASGKGGVGKSTVSLNIAYNLIKKGFKVGLIDSDIYGPSIPKMIKIDSYPKQDGDKIIPAVSNGLKVISMGMFTNSKDQAAILRGPMLSGILKNFLSQIFWGEIDYLILDTPPGTGDIHLSISQLMSDLIAFVVTTPQELSVIDAKKALYMFKTLKIPVYGIIENMSFFKCDSCLKEHRIFGHLGGKKISDEFDIPLIGHVPLYPEIIYNCDTGGVSKILENLKINKYYKDITDKIVNLIKN